MRATIFEKGNKLGLLSLERGCKTSYSVVWVLTSVDNKKIPLADDFLINYLVTPEDLDACESYIIERMEYRVSDNCAWIKELKESLTTTHR